MSGRLAAILDIDGTLVDTNYHHAVAWYRAFKAYDVVVPVWRIHRHVGMGGDHLVAALTDDATEERLGDDIREAEKKLYAELIDEVVPMAGAADLVSELKERGHPVILASSAKEDEVDHYLDLLRVRDVVDGWTTSADVDATKPNPDLVAAAVGKAGTDSAVMVGDSIWDCEAASRAGLETIGVLTGGFARAELEERGAVAVFESVEELHKELDETPLR
ncbi:MAG TPA: HAD family hydrolase [Actinomycetota bacterium]|nr:HAD family hydrolase [Actinomycetota bacterium]